MNELLETLLISISVIWLLGVAYGAINDIIKSFWS